MSYPKWLEYVGVDIETNPAGWLEDQKRLIQMAKDAWDESDKWANNDRWGGSNVWKQFRAKYSDKTDWLDSEDAVDYFSWVWQCEPEKREDHLNKLKQAIRDNYKGGTNA